MATGPTLPPQAYTREILAIAFQWLQGQPESIKKLAQSPDALVGLYLRAQRYGNASPETDAPISAQNFLSDLKNLAEGLKQFEDPNRGEAGQPFRGEAGQPKEAAMRTRNPGFPMPQQRHDMARESAPYSSHVTHASHASHAQHPQHQQHPPQSPTNPGMQAHNSPMLTGGNYGGDINSHLNPASQAMIQEVKSYLNLSSDIEVVNMMIAIAYKNVKNLLG